MTKEWESETRQIGLKTNCTRILSSAQPNAEMKQMPHPIGKETPLYMLRKF